MRYDVFISYRRDGGDTLAQLLYDRLTQRGYRVFLDIESLNSGKFNEKLLEVIEECKDIVVVLPPNALDRCHNEDDWVLRELEHSIKLSKNIVPVLMKNFEWPEHIPESIAEIKNYNGIVDNKDYFDAVIDKIVSLLKCKPVLLGGIFKRKVRPPKNNYKNQVKKYKRIFILLLAFVVILGAMLGLFAYREKQKRIMRETYVNIRVTPNEEMSASEYYDAIDILEERFDILAGDKKYLFEEKKDTVSVSIPKEVFHGQDIEKILDDYVLGSAEIYLCSENYQNDSIKIERSDIKEVEIISDYENIDLLKDYKFVGIKDYNKCKIVAIKLQDGVYKSVDTWAKGEKDTSLILAQDIDKKYVEAYMNIIEMDKDSQVIYLANPYQYDNLLNLLQYNYSNQTFSESFSAKVLMPVQWEYKEETNNFGKNQCNIDELKGNVARIDFASYMEEGEYTEGEFYDVVRIFKLRLDALGIPYALGYEVENKTNISVKLDPQYINNEVVELLSVSYNPINVRTKFQLLADGYDIESAEVVEKKNGNYRLQITLDQYWNDSDNMEHWEDEIYLCYENEMYINVPLCKGKKETFFFDNLSYLGIEKVTEKEKYLLDLIKVIITEDTLPYSFKVGGVYGESDIEVTELYFYNETLSETVQKQYESEIKKITDVLNYGVTVSHMARNIEIDVALAKNDDFASNINAIIKTLYQNCDMGSGNAEDVTFVFREENLQGAFIVFSITVNVEEQRMEFSANDMFANDTYLDAIKQFINADEFYKQFYISPMHLDQDGKFTFEWNLE